MAAPVLIVTIPYRCLLRLLVMGVKIAVIGAGIGGLTAAIALARQGMAVEVYEQAPALEEVGAGVGLWPNAMAALELIGLSGPVARLAAKVDRQGLMRPDGSWLLCLPAELMTQRWGAGFVTVHRAELQQLLATELDPAVIHLGARFTGLEDNGRAVIARFADGREVQADVLGRRGRSAFGGAGRAVRARAAAVLRLHRGAVAHAAALGSAAPGQLGDLGPGRAFRSRPDQR